MEILELMDRLERMVTGGRKLPVFQRSMVDPQKLLEMVDQMRLAVPQSVQDAKEVLDRREQIMTQSLKDAQRTKAAAETEARVRVEEGELVKEGKKRADEIVYEAQIKGQRILDCFGAIGAEALASIRNLPKTASSGCMPSKDSSTA